MLVTPIVRKKPIVAFRKAAATSGPEPSRIRLASSSNDRPVPADPFEQLTRVRHCPRTTGDEVADFARGLAVLCHFALTCPTWATPGQSR
jgi:hypothetical protein